MHILCTICSDLVNQAENIYVTKCGHIFHHHCLAQWIERSKSCPQCRNKVTDKCMFRMYPTISNESSGEDAATLQSRLDDTQLQLRQQRAKCKEMEDKLTAINTDLKRNEELLKSYEKKLVSRDSAVSALKEQLDYVKIQNKETNRLKEENESLKKTIQTLNGLQKVLNATSNEVEQMLQGYTDVRTVATFATALKRALCESEGKKNESRDRLHAAKQQIGLERITVTDLQAKLRLAEDKLSSTERKYEALKNKRKASEMGDQSLTERLKKSVKQLHAIGALDTKQTTSPSNTSFNTMVNRIENADSPYLSLKQSSLALAALHVPSEKIKPSEYAMINAAMKKPSAEIAPSHSQKNPHSIFYRKQPTKMDIDENDVDLSPFEVSYDGLGGHSKLDTFPVPNTRPPLKSCVPKLTAKHKLKRPASAGSQDIARLFGSLRDK